MIIVNQDNVLISGHRRFQAAKELGWEKVPHIIKSFDDPNEEVEFLIRSNLYRTKTHSMIAKEVEKIKEVEKYRAELRKLKNLKNHNSFEDSDVRQAANGRVEKVIADKLHSNVGFVRNALKFSELTKDMEEEEANMYSTLFDSNVSGSLEAIGLNLYGELKDSDLESLSKEPRSLRKFITKVKLGKYKSRYSLVYCNPSWDSVTADELKDEEAYPVRAITKSKAKLFMLVDPMFISESLELIKKWGFTYYTNYIWSFGEGLDVKHKILFLAYKGKTAEFNYFKGVPAIKHSDEMPYLEAIIKEDEKASKLLISFEPVDGFDAIEEVVSKFVQSESILETVNDEGLV